jgi:D-alanyl-D-alanine carboxypeptidase/D-alanyl-D-alanine-endopeptidase (penicillin-binding protein 4)
LRAPKIGVEIVRLGRGPEDTPVLYQHDSAEPLIPASNLKAITTSAALEKLGANFKFRTLLLLHGSDLVLIGDGDPTWATLRS